MPRTALDQISIISEQKECTNLLFDVNDTAPKLYVYVQSSTIL